MKKVEHHTIKGTVNLLSSMRIGGSDDFLQIGATDLTVVKHPVSGDPYIPGSSLKGKIRSQLELWHGLVEQNGNPFGGRNVQAGPSYLLASIFGPHMNTKHDLGPSRILVRDGSLRSGGELEIKPEVMINRNTGVGVHPRPIERVSAGSTFRLKIDLQVFDIDTGSSYCSYDGVKGSDAMIAFIKTGLRLVEQTGLGSSVSRGSGEIEFIDLDLNGVPLQLPTILPKC